MRRLGSTGVLIAASQLPVAAHDRPEAFSNRGSHERLSLSFATVEIGLQKPFSILHISDSHLTAAYAHESAKKQELHRNRTETFGGRQEEALHDALVWAKQHVDYVLHTGDLIDWQSEANLDLVRKYFGSGVIGTVGNHEFSPDMWLSDPPEDGTEAFKDRTRALLEEAYSFDTRFQAQVVNGVNFVTLDNVYGTGQRNRYAALRRRQPVGYLWCSACTYRFSRTTSGGLTCDYGVGVDRCRAMDWPSLRAIIRSR